MERILRKISLATLQPCEWMMIDTSMEKCSNVLTLLKEDIGMITKIRDYYQSHLNIQECEKYNLVDIHTSLFQKGIYTDVDALDDTIQLDMEQLKALCNKITSIGENENTLCRIDYNDRDGYFLSITKKRWENVIKVVKKIDVEGRQIILSECKVKPISSSSSNLRLSHRWIEELSDRIISNQRRLSNMNVKYYKEFLIDLDKNYHEEWMNVLKIIISIIS